MNIIEKPSPNFDSRDGHIIDMLVLHYTGMPTAVEALERLCDPAAKVSAHYVVDEDGTIYRLVSEENRAWHAGKSSWRGHDNINQRSIGIEIVNPGHEFGYRAFPKAQMESVAKLCNDILSRHNILAHNIVGHSDVAPIRKEDPGELFDWQWLAGQGVGVFPSPLVGEGGAPRRERGGLDNSKIPPLPSMVKKRHLDVVFSTIEPPPQGGRELEKYGYNITDLPKAITAFQRRFRPKSLNGQWDNECAALLASLLDAV